MPVEATENVAPIILWRKELKPDSGGAGLTRGGVGQIMEIATKGDLEFAVQRQLRPHRQCAARAGRVA